MSKKDYTLKFYKGKMVNDNQDIYYFYLAARSEREAEEYIENYVNRYSERYHIIPGENEISKIRVVEVSMEDYGKSYGYEIIN